MAEPDNKFDGIFMSVLQQKADIALFFDAVYGFLRRNTDFFSNQVEAEKIITTQCGKHYTLYLKEKKEKEEKEAQKKAKEEQRKKEKEAEELKKKQAEEQKRKEKEAQEAQKGEANNQMEVEKAPEEQPKLEQTEQLEKVVDADKKEGDKKDDDEKPPIGNGGTTDKYIWTQTLEEVQIYVPIPQEVTKKQLNVKIESNSLLVVIQGQEPLIKGELFENIQADDSIWTITDGEIQHYKGKYIHISIEKWTGQMHWWESICKGHPKINTQKINPEPSKLSDLDGETKSTVDKMMFDMHQKQKGLPSSDELQKRSKLEQFMKSHPEMDFSKCKFN